MAPVNDMRVTVGVRQALNDCLSMIQAFCYIAAAHKKPYSFEDRPTSVVH